MKICNVCGTENDDSAMSCIYCGESLPDSTPVSAGKKKKKGGFSFGKKQQSAPPAEQICPCCGTVNSADAANCVACNTELGGVSGGEGEFGSSGTITCPNCGMENEATETYCVSCGVELDSGSKMTCPNCFASIPIGSKTCPSCGKRQGSGSRVNPGKLAWVAAGVAAIAAVAIGVNALIGSISNPVDSALDTMADTLAEQIHEMSNLGALADNYAALNDSGEFTIILEAESAEDEISGTVYYDRGAKLMSGSLEADFGDLSGGYNFSATNRDFMMQKQGSQEIFGCSASKLSKSALASAFNNSQVAQVLGVKLDKDLLNNLFKKMDEPEDMEDDVEKAWKQVVGSFTVEETNQQEGCRVYLVSLDPDALNEFLNTLLGEDEGFGRKILLTVLNASTDIHLFINENDQLVKADMMLYNDKAYMTFSDSGNPWSNCAITSDSGNISGYLKADSSGIDFRFNWNSKQGNLVVVASYDDSSGAFHFEYGGMLGGSASLDGKISSRNGQALITIYGYDSAQGSYEMTIGLDDLETEPAELSSNGKYTDMLDSSNWNRLLYDTTH